MSKKRKTSKPERVIEYITFGHLQAATHKLEEVLEKWIGLGYLKIEKIGENGEKLFDKEVCFKRIKNLEKWRNKDFSPEVIRTKLDSAIKHTHRWGDDFVNRP